MDLEIRLKNVETRFGTLEEFANWWDELSTSDQLVYLKYWLEEYLYSVQIKNSN